MAGRILVVGASLGGLRAAEQLRAAGWTGELVLVGAEPHMPYNRPPLSKEALAGRVTFESLALRPRPRIADAVWHLGDPAVTCSSGTTGTAGWSGWPRWAVRARCRRRSATAPN